jgi:hypothetical protein
MRNFISVLVAIIMFAFAGVSHARDPIDNGKLQIKPGKDNTFQVGEFRLGKAELFGYVGDLKGDNKLTGLLLLQGDKATPEQKHIVLITAQAQKLEAFIDQGGKIQPLTESAAPAPASPPAVQ